MEGSRGRLGVEAIDLYQIHWPVPEEIVAAANLTLDKHDIATLLRRK